MNLIGYVRVSTEMQGDSGLGMEAQRASIEGRAAYKGWTLVRWEEDIISSRRMERPGLMRALASARAGEVDGIIVAKLDRLGRKTAEISALLAEAAESRSWMIVSLSPEVDMSNPYGKAMAHMAIVFSELERDMISLRTREALAAKTARGEPIGKRPEVSAEAERIVYGMRLTGHSHRRMADRLNREGIPTVNGGAWTRSTVQRIIDRQKRQEAATPTP